MVQIIGELESSQTVNGTLVQVFNIPAFSERMARRRASANSRAKGLEGGEVTEVEVESQGSLPGQSIYKVRVESPR